jgi:hypothetical protein
MVVIGLKNGCSSETGLDRFLLVSQNRLKISIKFKMLKRLNQIDKSYEILVSRLVLPVYRTGFEQNRFRQF